MRHVIGFGNPLHGDDGFAAAACAVLQALPLAADVRVFDAGTRGLDAMALFAGCNEVIIIDAALPAGCPGRIEYHSVSDVIATAGLVGHVDGVGAVLFALSVLGGLPPRIRLLTAEAYSVRPFSPGLSLPLEQALTQLISELSLELCRPELCRS